MSAPTVKPYCDLITKIAKENSANPLANRLALKAHWPEVLKCLEARGWAQETIAQFKAEVHGETQ